MKKKNPFPITSYIGAKYFCDREVETQFLMDAINNSTSITLFAYRRLGKTGLIKHVFGKLKKRNDLVVIYIDILGTTSLDDFTNQLATSIYNSFPANKSMGRKIIEAIQSLRPTISFDELSGAPTISISNQKEEQKIATLNQLFSFLDSQGKQIIISIDEFQQILEYPEKNIEAILRTQMQKLQHTSFIFCGSNQNMMHEIFNSAKRPFFASCTPMHLGYIDEEKYKRFIISKFEADGREIDNEAVTFICEWTLRHTFYTQYFCNRLFSMGYDKINISAAKETALEILAIHENSFYQYRNLLTKIQWNVLRGIANEIHLFKPNAIEFKTRYNLGSSSSINRAMESLLNKEIIFRNNDVENPYYEVYDKFLMRWMQSSK